ncbi:MAG: hypothetical protein AAGD38_20165, partial [Acidobacteriota bacterium]
DRAGQAARFVSTHLRDERGVLQHTWRRGEASVDAFLADYAYLLHGLIALARATDDPTWLRQASRLADQMIDRLAIPEGGFYSAVVADDLLVRNRPIHDAAVPAANGTAILALIDLGEALDEPRYLDIAERALRAFAGPLSEGSGAYPTLARAVLRWSLVSAAEQVDKEPPPHETP